MCMTSAAAWLGVADDERWTMSDSTTVAMQVWVHTLSVHESKRDASLPRSRNRSLTRWGVRSGWEGEAQLCSQGLRRGYTVPDLPFENGQGLPDTGRRASLKKTARGWSEE